VQSNLYRVNPIHEASRVTRSAFKSFEFRVSSFEYSETDSDNSKPEIQNPKLETSNSPKRPSAEKPQERQIEQS
jgi:hypothetical protein